VVDNRPGAGGNIGADVVAKATDGHTLLMATIGTAAINYGLYRNSMPYKPADLTAVSDMAAVPNVIIASPKLEARTLQDLVALAKRRPDGLTIGSSGNGTSLHLTGELLSLTVSVLASHSDWLVEAAGTPGQTGDEGHGEAPSHGGDRVWHVALRPDGRPLADGNRGVGQGFRSALG
jgi:hypothetical protein